jgi:hypothetical protein
MEKLDQTMRGVEGGEIVRETLTEAFEEAKKLTEILGRAKLSPEVDIETMKRKIKSAAETAADTFATEFARKLKTKDFNVKVNANVGSFKSEN